MFVIEKLRKYNFNLINYYLELIEIYVKFY